ncbi:MAG TPA: hypothetical protein VMU77_04395 [Acidimicrobiales bacterium]|nr:hypothetical protein [Acidimicrobiales bacterium]
MSSSSSIQYGTEFEDNDAGYMKWLKANPKGFVINCDLKPIADYVVLHKSNCKTISGEPAKGEGWTVAYKKVCSDMAIQLELWSRRAVGVLPHRCEKCQP